ncbi:hypothetical protein C0992_009136 [Termitomyces sp. T32_za158]|nr:hypothetical protein C0992_009136 [Termitomyces sp. T32_za158]
MLYGRMGDLFNWITSIVECGLKYEVDTTESLNELTTVERHLLESWRLLKELIPNFAEDMVHLRHDRRTRNQVFSLINRARDCVCSDDCSSLKVHAPSYMLLSKDQVVFPPLLKGDKTVRGWAHPQCAALLCPAELPATEETYANIESGEIIVTADQFPRFLYPHGHEFDPDNLSKDILRGHFCFRVGKHIFQGPSASHEKAGFSRGKSGNAAINGISSMTPRSIAYIACQARFAISSAVQWGFWDKDFNYENFYWNIVDLFEDGEGQDIIEAFN